MKNPFKSKYYFRILDKIAELENERAKLQRLVVGTYYINTERFHRLNLLIAEIESKIKVLRGLL